MSRMNNGTWIRMLLPLVVILGLAGLVMAWHMAGALAILFVGLGILIARYIQRREPRSPGG